MEGCGAPEGGAHAKFFEYSVHILAYNSIIEVDAASGNCGGDKCLYPQNVF